MKDNEGGSHNMEIFNLNLPLSGYDYLRFVYQYWPVKFQLLHKLWYNSIPIILYRTKLFDELKTVTNSECF